MNIQTIKIGFSIEFVRAHGFSQCRKVKSVTFDQNSRLQIIEDYGFYDFYLLTSLTFTGNNLTKIGKGAFCYSFALQSVAIPPSVTFIGTSAFRGIDSLRSFNYCGSSAITEDVFNREVYNGHVTPSNFTVKVTGSYHFPKFATDFVSIDNSLSCNFPRSITYDLICKLHSNRFINPQFSYFFVFLII